LITTSALFIGMFISIQGIVEIQSDGSNSYITLILQYKVAILILPFVSAAIGTNLISHALTYHHDYKTPVSLAVEINKFGKFVKFGTLGKLRSFLSKILTVKIIFSPTFFLARKLKANKVGDERKNVIQNLNYVYLIISIVSLICILVFQSEWSLADSTPISSLSDAVPSIYKYSWFYFLFSRCNEIFFAFLSDASDKLKRTDNTSSLEFYERLSLSLKSYIELIVNFAIMYMLTSTDYWAQGNLVSVSDALFYSAATITTLADGSLSPNFWLVQFLTIYQIFCGFSLLIVCFTVYTSRAVNEIGQPEDKFKVTVNGTPYNVSIKSQENDV
jgi:voltage-gated potassium channel